jgi:acetyl esterase
VDLDPEVQALYDAWNAEGPPPPPATDLAEFRRRDVALAKRLGGKPVAVARVENRVIEASPRDLAVRLYWGTTAPNLPLVTWFHGGGFVAGSVESSDAVCRILAAGIPALVASVEYPLAPEFPFPAGIEDAYGVLQWLRGNAAKLGGRDGPFVLGGESAGGTVAAAVSRRLRAAGAPLPALQVLVYPATDVRPLLAEPRGPGGAAELGTPAWWAEQYLRGADPGDPDASLVADPAPGGLPSTIVVSGGADPMAPEGAAYVRLLAAAGVDAREKLYPGMPHGFFGWNVGLRSCAVAHEDVVGAIRKALKSPAS